MNEKQKEYARDTDAEYVSQFLRLRRELIDLTTLNVMTWDDENERHVEETIEQMRKTVSDLCRLRALVHNLERYE